MNKSIKNLMKKIVILLGVISLMMSMSSTAFADGTVTYNGDARKFIFEPGSKYSPTDLFTDFKDVMPGDSITQKVHIKNDVSNNVKIKLYMRSLGAHEDSKEFLSKLQLRVSQDGTSNLFDAPADQTAQLTDWVYLGTFYSGAEIDLNVTLDVPIELGNEYQNAIGYLDWQFKVEELPVESSDPNPPQTGDTTNLYLYVAVACVTGIVLVVLIGRRHGKSNRETF